MNFFFPGKKHYAEMSEGKQKLKEKLGVDILLSLS